MDNNVETRLREISDEIVQLRTFQHDEPANELLIDLLEMERAQLKADYIKAVT